MYCCSAMEVRERESFSLYLQPKLAAGKLDKEIENVLKGEIIICKPG